MTGLGGSIIRSRTAQRFTAHLAEIAAAIALLVAAGCSKQRLSDVMHPNQRPTVSISQSPAAGATPSSYTYEISWAGSDPDGHVVAFRWALDAPSAAGSDTAWVTTRDNRHLFLFAADSLGSDHLLHRFHTFVVEAIDDRSAASLPAIRSFNSTTVAPTVSITSPVPSSAGAARVAPSLHIAWTGDDPDGVGNHRPVSWRYIVLNSTTEITSLAASLDPDTLRRRYAPDFTGWHALPGNVTSVDLRDLVQSQFYLFVIVAIDTAGAYSPVFSLNTNMLAFMADPLVAIGPQLTVFNDRFFYRYPSGGFFTTQDAWLQEDFPAEVPLQLKWSAVATSGSFVRGYRWALDLASIDDETPRTDEATDLAHWSRWGTDTAILLPPFPPATGQLENSHVFYLEAEDEIGRRSAAVMRLIFTRATFDRPVLIVDDTWFRADKLLSSGCVDKPRQTWPTSAELDTFLYAVGNKPWRCYPAGTSSSPGLFAGYDFDTLGAHFVPGHVLALSTLDRYRNIIWLTDANSAFSYNQPFSSNGLPMPLLRALTQSLGVNNVIGSWLQQGGRLWLLGGGAAYATLRDYGTLTPPTNVFSFDQGELVTGRFMYTYAHWQSEITVDRSNAAVRSDRAVGGWTGAPDYAELPLELDGKSAATDPLPPQRSLADGFYSQNFVGEYLTKPNWIFEQVNGPSGRTAQSMLDTLYLAQGNASGDGHPIMTYYHGSDSGPLVFSGFPIWYFQRAQAISVVDFVLQRIFGLTRRNVPR